VSHRVRRLAVTAGAMAVVTVAGVIALPGAQADPIGDARARAAALNQLVDSLTVRAEVASQRYDAIQARLAGAVNGSLSSDRRLEALHQQVENAQQLVNARVQALYASGGSLGTFAALLSGDANSAVARTQMTASVITTQTQAIRREEAVVKTVGTQADRKRLSATQVVQLESAAARQRATVVGLLAEQRAALSRADSTVRRLVRQQQRAAELAAAQSFTQAVSQAGGQVDGGQLAGGTRAPNPTVAAALAAARSRLGDPYVWGATGPTSFDCSGLTQWSYAHAGIALPRTAAEQWFTGPHPSLAQLEPGDLLFWATDLSDPATIHHVTIYIGNGLMIAAPHTGTVVQVQPVYLDGFFGATRPWASQS